PSATCHMRTCLRESPRDEARVNMCDLERAREQVLRIRAQLVAPARCVADDDLFPADAIGAVAIAIGEARSPMQTRAVQDDLESRRLQPARTIGMRERPLDGNEMRTMPIYRQLGAARDSTREGRLVDPSSLERRDLGEVEHVAHIDARTGNLDAAEPVDREGPQWMRGRSSGRHEESEHDAGGEQA